MAVPEATGGFQQRFDTVGAFKVDAAAANGLTEVPHHGPGHFG